MKIYLVGPDVFRPDCLAWAESARRLVADHGHQALIPLDSEESTAEGIYRANIRLIAEADALLANLNPFRGSEPDSGTVFEIGYAIALGKRVVGYLEDARTVEVTARKRYFFRKTRRVSVRSAARRFSMARTSGPTMSQPPNSGRLI